MLQRLRPFWRTAATVALGLMMGAQALAEGSPKSTATTDQTTPVKPELSSPQEKEKNREEVYSWTNWRRSLIAVGGGYLRGPVDIFPLYSNKRPSGWVDIGVGWAFSL